MARISVLMGIYNCGSTLQEALDSLYAQTYQDFKIILCDDGSSDNTLAIAEQNARLHPNVVVIKNERNMGLNYTLNHCLEHADTEYCARMDGDDVCDPTRFEKQIKFMDEHPELALCSTPMYMFDEKGKWGETKCIPFPTKIDVITRIPSFTHAAVMIKTCVYKEVGGYTISDCLLRVEDCHLWFKIYAAGYIGGNLTEPLYGMRDDHQAIKRRNWKARRNSIYVTWCGYRMLHMPYYKYPKLLLHSIVEIAKFLMPNRLYEYFHHKTNK